ncbi:MAG: hypothetical protein KY475_00870 [Planctomycetes bacterium]|nr:hypothetical protein [Planctomycetota bacterium]
MRRFFTPFLFCLLIGLTTWPAPSHTYAQQEAEIPLTRAVLYASGVGFFEHLGEVEGEAQVDLEFSGDDINDLLQSLVLEDFGGGVVSAVTYDSREPLSRTLGAFAIDLTAGATMSNLLRQARGHQIEVSLADGDALKGRIVDVEQRPDPVGDHVIDAEVLLLKTLTGLRSVPLRDVFELRLLDKQLEEDFQKALELLASTRATDKKSIRLHFGGQGERTVRIGYIQEFPVWKTSYRLVLSPDGQPYLQGWAIVENLTERDWNDVQLTLVSGQPISFIMNLHQPLYIQRPRVSPEVQGTLRPQVYEQDLTVDAPAEVRGRFQGKPVRSADPAQRVFAGGGFGGGGFGGGMGGFGESQTPDAPTFDLRQGAAQLAETGEVGELFRYEIKSPVRLARRKSAMLPVVNAEVQAEKLAMYNPDVHAEHPLGGLRVKNTTDLHLMAGPIAVFDEGEFAGDARIAETAPGEDRLISYALDLNLEVKMTAKEPTRSLAAVKIISGRGETVYRWTREHHYVVKNSDDQAKRVLVEQPIDAEWELTSPKSPLEKTRSLYRFSVSAPPGETISFEVVEQKTSREEFLLLSAENDQLAVYMSHNAASPEVQQALSQVSQLRAALQEAEQILQSTLSEISEITQDQNRIRQNMQALDRDSALYRRYVEKFTQQEDQIETLRQRSSQQRKAVASARQRLSNFIEDLNVE